MPRYRFHWDAFPAGLLRRLTTALDPSTRDPAAALKKAYGARPRERFVADTWPILLDEWLTRNATARRSVVSSLRTLGLGDTTTPIRSASGQLTYLRGCRNSPRLRKVVLEHFITAGEAASPPKPQVAAPPPGVSAAPAPAPRSAAWPEFAQRLAGCLAELELDQFLVISLRRHPGYYVQFAQQGPSGMRAETVSNRYLDPGEQLDEVAESRLTELGWLLPTAGQSPERDPDGSPNHYRDWPRPVPYAEAAQLAVDTLVDVLDAHHPGHLQYNAFAHGGAPILLPNLGIPREQVSPPSATDGTTTTDGPATPADLRQQVDDALKPLVGQDHIEHDQQDDVPLRFGRVMVYVRILKDSPTVAIFAPVVWDIESSAAVLDAVNEVNASIRFARAWWTGKGITLAAEVPATPFVAEHLTQACVAVGQLSDHYAETLQQRFGGRIAFGPAVPPALEV